MRFSAHRLAKVVRTTCAPFATVLAFSVLLTIIFVLYRPTRGPGDPQKLRWQSRAAVSLKPAADGKVAIDKTTTQYGETSPGGDWWDVETPEPGIEFQSVASSTSPGSYSGPYSSSRTSEGPYPVDLTIVLLCPCRNLRNMGGYTGTWILSVHTSFRIRKRRPSLLWNISRGRAIHFEIRHAPYLWPPGTAADVGVVDCDLERPILGQAAAAKSLPVVKISTGGTSLTD